MMMIDKKNLGFYHSFWSGQPKSSSTIVFGSSPKDKPISDYSGYQASIITKLSSFTSGPNFKIRISQDET